MTQGKMIFKDAQMETSAVPFRQGGRDAYSMVMTLRELDDCLPDRRGRDIKRTGKGQCVSGMAGVRAMAG